MADISLRTYIEEIDGLIERKQVDEAVAHCRHILALYPKHLDAYRMLGKALLEKGRHGDAADIFQRVLSVAPDDFIAHVGMSIVREDEANLEAALWHMERAFETNPSNGAIQEELRRLYGRRDGVTPPRARLTRGALARMYALGELYHQAQAEIQAALAEDTDRVDLETTLAQIYFNSGQYTEAAQTCSHLIQKLPYSKEANRILGDILRAQGRVSEAAPYRQRLEAIDPYEAFSDPASNGQGAAKVKSEAIRLPKLDYAPGMDDSSAPDWVASAGLKFDDGGSGSAMETGTPDWLTNSLAPTTETVSDAEMPDWLREMQPAAPVNLSPEMTSDSPGSTDWLNALRGGETETAAPTSAQPAPLMPDWLQSATGALAGNSLPDWMKEETSPVSVDDTPDWMKSAAPGGEAAAAEPAADLPDWMQAAAPENEATAAEPAADLPDWMQAASAAAAASPAADDTPDWMRAATESPAAEPAAETPPWMQAAAPAGEVPEAEAATDIPDWMKAAAPVSAASQSADEVPAWMRAATGEAPEAEPATDVPDWMKAADAGSASLPPVDEAPAWMQAAAGEPAATEPAADMPDWMKAATSESSAADSNDDIPAWMRGAASAGETAEAEPAADMPDWMKAMSSARETPAAEPADMPDWMRAAASTAETTEAEPAADVPTWMQAAAPLAAVPAIGAMAEADKPDWLKQMEAESDAYEASLGAPTPPALNEPPAAAEAAEPASAKRTISADELPDFLKMASPEALENANRPSEFADFADELPVTDDVPAAEAAELPDWLKAMEPPEAEAAAAPTMTEAEAARWLAGLETSGTAGEAQPAASEGVTPSPAAEPETTPPAPAVGETEPVQLPEWLRPSARADTSGEAQPAVDLPDWIKAASPASTDTVTNWLASKPVPDWMRQPGAEAAAPPPEWLRAPAEAEPPATDLPDWATTTDAPTPIVPEAPQAEMPAAGDLASMDADEALRWLESLAAQQGARPEELITQPPAEAAPIEPVSFAAPAIDEPPAPAAQPALEEMDADEALRWLESLAAQQGAKPEELITAASDESLTRPLAWPATPPAPAAEVAPEATAAAQPDMSAMSEDDAMRWLESLAAQQGAKPEELITAPEERLTQPLSWPAPQAETTAEPVVSAAGTEPDMSAMSEDDAMRWLESLAAQQGARPEELITAPEERLTQPLSWPAPQAETASEPVASAAETEPDMSAMSEDDAMRWLESLAAQQGARPEELITTPEERVAEPPAWPATSTAPEPAAEAQPVSASSAEPDFSSMSADDAMRWLESLAAQQGARPEELITQPEERLAAPPAWVAATPASAPATPEPAVEPVAEAQSEMSEDDAMRWLESLAAQQGANPEELITPPEERASEPPAWVAAIPAAEPEVPVTPEPGPAASAEMSEDDAMRWLESLAAQQGANPEELITPPEERLTAPPTWVAVTPTPVSAEPETPPVVEDAPPASSEAEVAKWLESRAPAPEPVVTPPPLPARPVDKPEPSGTTKLSRLAEQLAAKRRAKDEDIARRFEEQRAEKEAAMREVQERMEQKKRPGTGPLGTRPGTGPLTRPGTGPMTRPGTGPMTRPGTGPIKPTRAEPPAEKAHVTVEPAAPRKQAMPSVRLARPKKGRLGKSPYAAQPSSEVFAQAQQRISEGDFDRAVEALNYLVATNQLVDETITELETFLRIQPGAVGLWQVLGDAYMKNNRLQKALDAYRQALGQL